MLVKAPCTVKLTTSDRSWPHMRGAGRSRFAPRIGHHRGYRAVAWRAGIFLQHLVGMVGFAVGLVQLDLVPGRVRLAGKTRGGHDPQRIG